MLGQTAWAGPCNAAETFVSHILVDVSEPPRPAVLEYIQIQSQTEPRLAPFVASRAHGILTQEYWNILATNACIAKVGTEKAIRVLY